MSKHTKLVTAAVALVAGAIAYVLYVQYALQQRLDLQLLQLDWTLADMNERNNQTVEEKLNGIEAVVRKNQNQPSDLLVLQAAKNLRSQTRTLLDTLHARREALWRVSGNATALELRNRNEADKVERYFGPGTPAERQLRQLMARYVARTAYSNDSTRLSLPTLKATPVVVALAALTQLEADVLARESRIQQAMARHVGAREIPSRLKIMATAESNTVAPGETYRAEFFVTKVLTIAGARVTCNGQPVVVGADGVGYVSFRAPTRPGPASWLATMRFSVNGRDTTFQRQVSYRVR